MECTYWTVNSYSYHANIHPLPPLPLPSIFHLLSPVSRIRDVLIRIGSPDPYGAGATRLRIQILLFLQWLSRCQQPKNYYLSFLFFTHGTIGTFKSVCEDNKLWGSHKTVEFKVLKLISCLLMQGSWPENLQILCITDLDPPIIKQK